MKTGHVDLKCGIHRYVIKLRRDISPSRIYQKDETTVYVASNRYFATLKHCKWDDSEVIHRKTAAEILRELRCVPC